MSSKYDDIIELPHPTSKKHPRMAIRDRAAQFAPFAALVGYDDAVEETARITDDMIEQSDEMKEMLNKKLSSLEKRLSEKPSVAVTYFIPDDKKSGGRYNVLRGQVIRIDSIEKILELSGGKKIEYSKIYDITE